MILPKEWTKTKKSVQENWHQCKNVTAPQLQIDLFFLRFNFSTRRKLTDEKYSSKIETPELQNQTVHYRSNWELA